MVETNNKCQWPQAGVYVKAVRKQRKERGSCTLFRGWGCLRKNLACILPYLQLCSSEERGLLH